MTVDKKSSIGIVDDNGVLIGSLSVGVKGMNRCGGKLSEVMEVPPLARLLHCLL